MLGALQSGSMQGATPLILAIQYKHPQIALELMHIQPKSCLLDAKVPVDGTSALFAAIGEGYVSVAWRILDLGADIEIANNHGATALSYAVIRGRWELVKGLIERGANLDTKLLDGSTLLHVSAQGGHASMAKRLLEVDGLDPNAMGPDGMTPLHMAARGGYKAVMEVLLARPSPVGGHTESIVTSTGATALLLGAQRGNLPVMKLLLEKGADPNTRGGMKLYGATPLYMATQGGHEASVRLLLSYGSSVDESMWEVGVSPLFLACERGHASIVDVLLKAGADPLKSNANGLMPIHIAAMTPRRETIRIIKSLMENGAIIEQKGGERGETPLIGAVKSMGGDGTKEGAVFPIIEFLLLQKVDLNVRDGYNGETALMHAVKGSHQAIVKLLMKDGVDCSILNEDGETAMVMAQKSRDFDMIKLLGTSAKCISNTDASLAVDGSKPSAGSSKPILKPEHKSALSVLGLEHSAEWDDVVNAHRRLRKEMHPDKLRSGKHDGDEAFVAVNHSFDYLKVVMS